MATRTDFFVRSVVRRRRAFRGLKTSSEQIGRNVYSYSVLSDFLGQGFLPVSQQIPIRTWDEEIERVVRRVVRVVRFLVREARTTHRTRKPVCVATALVGDTNDPTGKLSLPPATFTLLFRPRNDDTKV